MRAEEARQVAEDLPSALGQALVEASGRKGRGEGAGRLHQTIVGPLTSGKTTLAQDYAMALSELGLVKKEGFITIHYFEQLDRDQLEARFEGAKGGVIIIDDITRHVENASDLHPLTSYLWRALASEDTTVILTGYKDKMEEFAASAPPEKRELLPEPVELEKSFSFEERQAFTNPNEARRKARQEKRKVAEEWENASDITLKTGKGIPLPKKATFGKKDNPKN